MWESCQGPRETLQQALLRNGQSFQDDGEGLAPYNKGEEKISQVSGIPVVIKDLGIKVVSQAPRSVLV